MGGLPLRGPARRDRSGLPKYEHRVSMLPKMRKGGRTPRAVISTDIQPPAYVRGTGYLTVVLGAMIFIWLPYVGHPWVARAAGAAMIVGGVGLAWGRLIPMTWSIRGGLPFLIVGCLLLVGSMTRATRSWLMGRPISTHRRPTGG